MPRRLTISFVNDPEHYVVLRDCRTGVLIQICRRRAWNRRRRRPQERLLSEMLTELPMHRALDCVADAIHELGA